MYDALFLLPGCEQIAGENLENYAQLDSLCLSVTEHALGSSLGRYTYCPHGPAGLSVFECYGACTGQQSR